MIPILPALETLKNTKKKLENGGYIPYGICTEFYSDKTIYGLQFYMQLIDLSWDQWPKYSGDHQYPVRIFNDQGNFTSDIDPAKLYLLTAPRGYWTTETEYGRNRRELLDWLIEQFQLAVDRIEASESNHA